MKFMIGVDCEGPACVVGESGNTLCGSGNMAFAREQATREANAAASALFDSGAESVVVWDTHGAGANLLFDRLDKRCEMMLGAGFKRRFPGLDAGFDGVLMIGYHAMEGTPDGVLAHTYSPGAYREIRVGGEPVGEIALDAAVAGALEVPLMFVSSDHAGCKEAKQFAPWIEIVATKRGLGINCAYSKHPMVAAEEIYQGVRAAVDRLDRMKPLVFPQPVVIEIRFKRPLQALKAGLRRKGWRLKGLRKIRVTLPSMLEWQC